MHHHSLLPSGKSCLLWSLPAKWNNIWVLEWHMNFNPGWQSLSIHWLSWVNKWIRYFYSWFSLTFFQWIQLKKNDNAVYIVYTNHIQSLYSSTIEGSILVPFLSSVNGFLSFSAWRQLEDRAILRQWNSPSLWCPFSCPGRGT